MIRFFCDACGSQANQLYPFRYLIHLENPNELHGYMSPQRDGTWESVSGREEKADLCLKCYNRILKPSVTLLLSNKAELNDVSSSAKS